MKKTHIDSLKPLPIHEPIHFSADLQEVKNMVRDIKELLSVKFQRFSLLREQVHGK